MSASHGMIDEVLILKDVNTIKTSEQKMAQNARNIIGNSEEKKKRVIMN